MNFIKPIVVAFENLSDAKTALYSAEGNVIIKSVRCCSRSDKNIRLNLQLISLLRNPYVQSYLVQNLLVFPNQTTDLMAISFGNYAQLVEHRLMDGDSLVCFSDGYENKFDCIVSGYEEVEDLSNI